MKKIIIFFLINFFFTSSVLAEIIFKDCDLSPNYGKVSMQVFLEKNIIIFEDSNGVSKTLKINEKNSTNISANDISNKMIEELFLIDLKHGVIRVTLKPTSSADQSTKEIMKNKKSIINTVCEPKNLYTKEQQQDQGVIIGADMEKKIMRSRKQCEMSGLKMGTDKENNEMMGCVAYVFAILEERELARKLKEKENIELNSEYESKSGKKINKDSMWTKFWQGVGWILHEHGEEIFNVILDVKYGTNYSGYNTQTVSNTGRLNCVSQRVGTVIHQNCKGNGVHIYCMYQKVSNTQWKRTCREK